MNDRKTNDLSWELNRQGFVQHYLVSGPLTEPFMTEERDTNQLRYEARLRQLVAHHEPVTDFTDITDGHPGRLGLPWRFQGGRDGDFLNLSDFYPTMRRVRFDAATMLIAPEEARVQALVWSYTAVDVYLNGTLVGQLPQAVYKPIQRLDVTLHLQPGLNLLYLACETLGVRDTRSVLGLQLPDIPGDIRVTLPDEALAVQVSAALAFLEGTEAAEDRLRFPVPAPFGTAWAPCGEEPDYAKACLPQPWQGVAGQTEAALPAGLADVEVRLPAGRGTIRRRFERTAQIQPRLLSSPVSPEENLRVIERRVAGVQSLNRGDFGFPIANLLARLAQGQPGPEDPALFQNMLDLIEQRVDCADFLVCGLIRYLKNYPVSTDVAARVRKVLTHFRYWMDQQGFDGMCFWSENHCLMFYASAMLVGEMYPDDDFPLAGRSGRELSAWGRQRVLDWLEDVETWGFEEFHSTVYMCVTFAALINLVDYGGREISARAAALTDQLLRQLADHTFKGGIIAPQGRVYRGVLYPFRAGAMALMNLADPAQPYDFGEGWLGFYATSRYLFPADLKVRMSSPASLNYVSGNARILLEKQEDWCLTSVQIPREPFERWENEIRKPEADPGSHGFVKSYNECFHGTTCFQPGVYGYQQHLWYAALDGQAVVFVNHPGSPSEGGDMRPGYWHGNGVFPALKQQGNLLGCVYRIPDTHPLHFVHAYCPECRFDEVRREGNWLLLRRGQGYIGLWASLPFEPWTGLDAQVEQRLWGSEVACLCVCAGREVPDLDAFAKLAQALQPAYDIGTATLQAGDFSLTYVPGADDTQYL